LYVLCEDGEKCLAGACKIGQDPDPGPSLCKDDDPEDDIYVPGMVMYKAEGGAPQGYPDQCAWWFSDDPDNPGDTILKNKVLQYGCILDGQEMTSVMSDCGLDEACYEGACHAKTTVWETCDFKCVDTDGGKDVLVGGSVFAVSAVCGKTALIDDGCTNDPMVVIERFCFGDMAVKQALPCPAGYFCRELSGPGRCVACQDSDELDDPAAFGQVDDIDGIHVTDFCNSDGALKQAQCDPAIGLTVWADPEPCAPGEKCVEGKCD